VYSEKTPDDGHRNCPKHVEFYSKNKFQKLLHLFGFIIRFGFLFLEVQRPSVSNLSACCEEGDLHLKLRGSGQLIKEGSC